MAKVFFPSVQHEFVGVLANHLQDFIKEKHGLGYKYKTEEYLLRKFSQFTERYDVPKDTLPENIVKAWFAVNQHDSDRYRYNRFTLIKSFAEYMTRLGYMAYIPVRTDFGRVSRTFVPYIFTKEEIHRFFKAVDSLNTCRNSCSHNRSAIMPVFFRLLYCCGLRVSEVSSLKICDINTTEGVLTIWNSKFNKSRYVPLSAEINQVCSYYKKSYCDGRNKKEYFFPAPGGCPYSREAIYHVFREILRECEISHGGKGSGPRLHDLRHTFAVHCLAKFVRDGTEPAVALPRLSSYLGHKSLAATDQYLRMTAEVYPEISELLQTEYGDIIPLEALYESY